MPAPPKAASPAKKPEKPKDTGRFIMPNEGQKIARVAKEWAVAKTPYGVGKYAGGGAVKKEGADCSGATWKIYAEAGFPYGGYFNTVRFVNRVSTDSHFVVVWLKDLVGSEADFVKGTHFFKEVFMPQVGDIGWWHNGKAGHMVIYDNNAGTTAKGQQANVWTASNPTGDPFGPGRINWFDEKYNAPAKWYRYWIAP